MEPCTQAIVHGQVVGMEHCAFHAGGGSASLPCNMREEALDAEVAPSFAAGSRVHWTDRAADKVVNGTVLRCLGDCDVRVAVVRPYRSRSTVEVNTWALRDGWQGTWNGTKIRYEARTLRTQERTALRTSV